MGAKLKMLSRGFGLLTDRPQPANRLAIQQWITRSRLGLLSYERFLGLILPN